MTDKDLQTSTSSYKHFSYSFSLSLLLSRCVTVWIRLFMSCTCVSASLCPSFTALPLQRGEGEACVKSFWCPWLRAGACRATHCLPVREKWLSWVTAPLRVFAVMGKMEPCFQLMEIQTYGTTQKENTELETRDWRSHKGRTSLEDWKSIIFLDLCLPTMLVWIIRFLIIFIIIL